MLKLAIFDLDGTLYDHQMLHPEAMKEAARFVQTQFGLSDAAFESIFEEARREVKQRLAGKTSSQHSRLLYFKRFLEKIQQNPFLYAEALQDVYWNAILQKMKLRDGVVEVLDWLKKRDIKVAVSTNLTTQIQMQKISRLGIANAVDYLLTSEEAGAEKPDEKMFLPILAQFQCKPAEALFIGDDYRCDIKGAQNVGIEAILLGDGL